jgi:hypothetical protein
MNKQKPRILFAATFTSFCILLTLLLVVPSSANASQGSVAIVCMYPEDGGTYEFVDRFTYQITGVNTNTTVSISIDDGQLVPMIYEGMRNGTAQVQAARGWWYTWQARVPTMLESGKHTFQFFSHYYVWQEQDHYWAEFNAYSTLKSFTIEWPTPNPATNEQQTNTSSVYLIAALISQLSALLVVSSFKRCKPKDNT